MATRFLSRYEGFEMFVDSEMPKWFDPDNFCRAYIKGDKLMLCDIHWYDDSKLLEVARDSTNGYWWMHRDDDTELNKLVRDLSAKGYGLLVYTSEEVANEYRIEED